MDGIFGIGPLELFFIAIIALIVLGPERLPSALREAASMIRKLRELASEFTNQFGDELKALDDINPRKIISDMVDPTKPLPGDKAGSPPNKTSTPNSSKVAAASANALATSRAATDAANAAVRAKAAASIRPLVKPAAKAADAPSLVEGAGENNDVPANSILPPEKNVEKKIDKNIDLPRAAVTSTEQAAKGANNGNGMTHGSTDASGSDVAGSSNVSGSDVSGSDVSGSDVSGSDA